MPRSKKTNKLGVRPLGKRVIVSPVQLEAVSAGGVMLPDSMREKPDEAEVIAVGDHEDVKLEVGDIVFLPSFCGTPIDVDGTVYRVINYEDIIAAHL